MNNKTTSRLKTALDMLSDPIDPLSDEENKWLEEERKRRSVEWAIKNLERISHLIPKNEVIARRLCETAAECARNDPELSDLIKENLKQRVGRPERWPPYLMRNLLIHYANAMCGFDNDHERARKWTIDYIHRTEGVELANETIENLISRVINYIRNGKFRLHDFPDWAQPIIQARLNKGTQTRKRTNMQNRNKP